MKTLRLSRETFEAVRRSVERLPADGDSFEMDLIDMVECKECAFSHDAAVFASRAKRLTKHGGIITVTVKP